jgi:hypothetical protein
MAKQHPETYRSTRSLTVNFAFPSKGLAVGRLGPYQSSLVTCQLPSGFFAK